METMRGAWDYSSLAYVPTKRSSFYNAFRVLSNAKKCKRGVKETNKVIENYPEKVKAVYIAEGKFPPEVLGHLPPLCQENNIPCISLPKEVLQALYGTDESVAVLQLGRGTRRLYERLASEALTWYRRMV